MKSLTGSVVSSKRMSLSKAATALKKFLTSDNGANQDMLAYVRRASTAFDELVEFHKEISVGWEGPAADGDAKEEKKKTNSQMMEEAEMRQLGVREEKKEKKEKKKKKMREMEVSMQEENETQHQVNGLVEGEDKLSHKKKKKKNLDVEEGFRVGQEGITDRHHKKRKREREEENGLGVGGGEVELQRNEKKKGKNAEDKAAIVIEGGEEDRHINDHHHKKKKRKVREEV